MHRIPHIMKEKRLHEETTFLFLWFAGHHSSVIAFRHQAGWNETPTCYSGYKCNWFAMPTHSPYAKATPFCPDASIQTSGQTEVYFWILVMRKGGKTEKQGKCTHTMKTPHLCLLWIWLIGRLSAWHTEGPRFNPRYCLLKGSGSRSCERPTVPETHRVSASLSRQY